MIEPIDCQPKKNEPSTSSCVTVFESVAAFQIFCLYNVHVRNKGKLTPNPRSCCILKTKEKTTLTILVHASLKSTSKMSGNLEDEDREFVPVTRVVMHDRVQNERSFIPIPSPPTVFSTHSCPTRGIRVCLVRHFWGRHYFHPDSRRNESNKSFCYD